MDAAERELFATTLRGAAGDHTGVALDAALEELGWRDALVEDPRAAVSLLFALQGEANATSSALHHVVGSLLPALGGCDPPGTVEGEGGGLTVRGLGTAALRGATHERRDAACVVAKRGDEHLVVTVDPGDLGLRSVAGIDPGLGLVEVTGDRVPATTQVVLAPGAWEADVAAGQVAVAHELVGAARAMLRLARDHALERIQFGQPIAMFQAVRHRLAESLVAVEAADAALGAAWEAGSPLTAALAKATAGRAARTTARHCQQVLAGLGFTTEHTLHRYVRRALVLDHLLGDARTLTRQLGENLLDSRRLPSLLPL